MVSRSCADHASGVANERAPELLRWLISNNLELIESIVTRGRILHMASFVDVYGPKPELPLIMSAALSCQGAAVPRVQHHDDALQIGAAHAGLVLGGQQPVHLPGHAPGAPGRRSPRPAGRTPRRRRARS